MSGSSLAQRVARLWGFLALVVIILSLFPVPPASAVTITRLLPSADSTNFPVSLWNSATDGCQVDAIGFDELDEFPHDGATTCRSIDVAGSANFEVVLPDITDNRLILSVEAFATARVYRVLPNGVPTNGLFRLELRTGATDCDPTGSSTIVFATAMPYTALSRNYAACSSRAWTLADVNSLQIRGSCEVGADITGCSVTNVFVEITFQEGDDGGGGDGGGGGGVPRGWNVKYPKSPGTCREIQIEDQRPVAALAILYVWNFGDGQSTTTTEGLVNHTYETEGLYTVKVRVQYTSGFIDAATIKVNARGVECLFTEFANDFFPLLFGLVLLMVVSSIVVVSSRRAKGSSKRLLLNIFLGTALVAVTIMVLTVLYMAWQGIRP